MERCYFKFNIIFGGIFMPCYMFKCEKCDNVYEEIVRGMPDEHICPKCGEKSIRIFTPPTGVSHKWKGITPGQEPTNKVINELGSMNFVGKQDLKKC